MKKVVSREELARKGAKFMSFGKDQSYGAVLDIEGEKIYYRKVDENEYRLMD